MAKVQEWVDSIIKDVPEPLEGTVARYVRMALQDFFRMSEVWRVKETTTLKLGNNTADILYVPAKCYAVAVDWAYFTPTDRERIRLTVELFENIDPNNSENRFDVDTIAMDEEGYSVLVNSDKEPGELELRYIVQPTREINEVPDLIVDRWFDIIRRGAMAKLLNMPTKPWTNSRAAMTYQASFEAGVLEAKREAKRDRSRPRRVVKFNPGFRW